ncbi:Peptide-methionine (S)-S-oxide reductase [Entomortierella chlamydospora]|uniref:peptide-methionine (S)-S-oxide reductase n=1 Tax=Entomortierella chlamydospora TaxID=101097 RepID=A0A9P6MXG3_9FUNG|nr:Peptide-methionine (S)-S-oxide reductase [Entomortierella chlamydospora]
MPPRIQRLFMPSTTSSSSFFTSRFSPAFLRRSLFSSSAAATASTSNDDSDNNNSENNTTMTEKATFAAGCFWGVEKAFQKHYKDEYIKTRVGYIGGTDKNPTYHKVCTGITNHAEALQIDYTPNEKINYPALVEFFYRMHDPTTLNSQGPDRGTQYRSAIFYHSPEQEEIAKRVTAEVQEKHYAGKKIVTQIASAGTWYDAEEYHQKYLDKNPYGYECPSHYLRW